MIITISDIVNLLTDDSAVRIYVADCGDVYEFDGFNGIPSELEDMEVDSIDNPMFADKIGPLVINVSEENFDDYKAFKEENWDNLTK